LKYNFFWVDVAVSLRMMHDAPAFVPYLIGFALMAMMLGTLLGIHLVKKKDKRALVLVLGDLARSPRMQLHALSLAQNGFYVDFVGYDGLELPLEIVENRRIHLHRLRAGHKLPTKGSRVVYILLAGLRILQQTSELLLKLLGLSSPHFIFCQVRT
jgi:hypothetical protein